MEQLSRHFPCHHRVIFQIINLLLSKSLLKTNCSENTKIKILNIYEVQKFNEYMDKDLLSLKVINFCLLFGTFSTEKVIRHIVHRIALFRRWITDNRSYSIKARVIRRIHVIEKPNLKPNNISVTQRMLY